MLLVVVCLLVFGNACLFGVCVMGCVGSLFVGCIVLRVGDLVSGWCLGFLGFVILVVFGDCYLVLRFCCVMLV